MAGVRVTVYNDDEFGRDIHVVRLGGIREKLEGKIQKPGEGEESQCVGYELCKGEMLIIVPADS